MKDSKIKEIHVVQKTIYDLPMNDFVIKNMQNELNTVFKKLSIKYDIGKKEFEKEFVKTFDVEKYNVSCVDSFFDVFWNLCIKPVLLRNNYTIEKCNTISKT